MTEKTMNASGLSRRNFLKGAGLGVASLTAAASLAACAPKGVKESSTGKPSADGTWDQETDIVVVGTGAAGVSAALSALEAGAQVVMLEKWDTLGGISSVCEQYCAYDSSLHIPQNFDDVEDSAEIMLEDAMRVSQGTADRELAKIYCDNSASCLDWMIENGCEFKDVLRVSDGRHGQGKYITATPGEITTKFLAAIESKGGEVLSGTPLVEIVREEGGRVLGVVCGEKEPMRIKANKGVIICAGPWSDDATMIKRHVKDTPEIIKECAEILAGYGMPYGPYTGEAIRAAQKIGASVRHMEYSMFDPYYSVPELMSQQIMPAGVTRAVNQILMTPEGKRFCDEGKSRGDIALDVIDLPGCTCYPVLDGRHVNDPSGSTKPPAEKLDAFAESGVMVKGETLEELTAKMEEVFGIPAAEALATIKRYNEACATGVDTEFGKDPHHMTPMDQAPFYAGPAETARIMYTHGGLEINADAAVVDLEGNVIEGLYAAGLCTGGPLGSSTISGNWQMSSIAFGRIAGASAAASAAAAE